MVRALEEEQETLRSRLSHFNGMQEDAGRPTRGLTRESCNIKDNEDSFSSSNDREKQRTGNSPGRNDGGASSPKSKKPSGKCFLLLSPLFCMWSMEVLEESHLRDFCIGRILTFLYKTLPKIQRRICFSKPEGALNSGFLLNSAGRYDILFSFPFFFFFCFLCVFCFCCY